MSSEIKQMTGCNLCSSNIVYGVMREVIIDGQKVYVCEDCVSKINKADEVIVDCRKDDQK